MGEENPTFYMKILSRILRRVEKFRDEHPQERARVSVAITLISIIGAPLELLTLLLHLPVILWDIFDPMGVDVPFLIHICFGFVYVGVVAFTILEIKEAWDVLELVYHPIKALKDEAVENIIKPLRDSLIKIDIVIGIVIVAVVVTDTISIFLHGFNGFHLVVYGVMVVIGALLFGISAGIYLLIKGLLVLLIDVIYRKMDKKFQIGEALEDFYHKVKNEEIVIDIEPT